MIAFAQKPGITDIAGEFRSPLRPTPVQLLYQGFVWIDPSSFHIVRLRQSLLAPRNDVFLATADADISYSEVGFPSLPMSFLLPKEVVVEFRFAGKQYHNHHNYVDFQLFRVGQRQVSRTSGFTFSSESVLVTVDAVVRTDMGTIVGDLQREDFAVYDNGVPQVIAMHSRERFPLAVALLVDCSPSIQPYLAQLRSAASAVLSRLKPEDELALYSFNVTHSRLSDLTNVPGRIAEMLGRIQNVNSSTDIYDVLYDAATYLHSKAPDRRRAIILISDNFQTVGSLHKEDEVLQELLRSSVMLYSIKTRGVDTTKGLLDSPRKIADFSTRTGGAVLNADVETELVKALDAALLNH